MDDSQEHNLGALVTQWYKKNGRQNLPWRKSVTPYKVWISEMMLQQTQVVTAQSYYRKFLKKYPSLSSMKMATEDDILSLWSGLGYYRRASFIYQAKEKIFLDFNGRFPTTYDELITLPGIGRSTAGAILSIAYQKPFPILDANVKRVIARLFLQKDFKEGLFWNLSAQCLDEDDPYSYQQGIMDIGATLCTPKAPLCPECPLKKNCLAFKKNDFRLPSTKKPIKKDVYLEFSLYKDGPRYFLAQTEALGFWKKLWMPPVKIVNKFNASNKHALSHRHIHFRFKQITNLPIGMKGEWFSKKDLANIALPKPISDKLLQDG